MNKLKVLFKRLNNKIFFVKVIYYYFKIFGAAPFNLQIKTSNVINSTRWFFKYSTIHIAYNFLLLFFIIIINCLLLKNDHKLIKGSISKSLLLVILSLVAIEVVTLSTFVLKNCFNNTKKCSLYNKINLLVNLSNSILDDKEIEIRNNVLFKKLQFLVASLLVSKLLVMVSLYFDNENILIKLHKSFNMFFNDIFTSQYLIVLEILTHFLSIVYVGLMKIKKDPIVLEIVKNGRIQLKIFSLNVLEKIISSLNEIIQNYLKFCSLSFLMYILCFTLYSIFCSFTIINSYMFGKLEILENFDKSNSFIYLIIPLILTARAVSCINKKVVNNL